jgi:hypothetical protein
MVRPDLQEPATMSPASYPKRTYDQTIDPDLYAVPDVRQGGPQVDTADPMDWVEAEARSAMPAIMAAIIGVFAFGVAVGLFASYVLHLSAPA